MSKEFVRGSQIYFHFLHMFLQSVKKISVISFLIAGFVMAAHFYRYSNHYAFKPDLAVRYGFARIYSFLNIERQIPFYSPTNRKIYLNNHQYISWYHKKILPEIKILLNKGFKWFYLTFITICLLFYFKGWQQKKEQYLRGIRLVKPWRLKKMIFLHNIRHFKFKPYKLAGFAYPKNTEFQHTIITGASGTGKTQAILDLLEQIRARGDKAIIYDKMGVYIRKFYNPDKDVILNPFDNRARHWDFFGEGQNKSDFDIMSASLIEERPNAADPFWTRSAKTILTESAFKLAKTGKGNNKELCDFLLKTNLKELVWFLNGTEAASIIDPKADKTAASIRSVVSTYINPIKFLNNPQENQEAFSIRNWVKNQNNDSFLFLSSIANKHESLKPLLSLWLDLSLNALLSLDQEKQKQRIWFIIDELPSLQRIPALSVGLAESRQFGGSFVISMQLMAQLREIYGRDGAESISGLCRNRLTFATPDKDTAFWCSENLGKKEIISLKENISFGASEIRDGVNLNQDKLQENIVIPSEIMSLKDLEFYIKLSNGFPVAKSKIEYQQRQDVANKLEERVIIEPKDEIIEDKQETDSAALEMLPQEEHQNPAQAENTEFVETDEDLEPMEDQEHEQDEEQKSDYF